jgi:hypothetical protein
MKHEKSAYELSQSQVSTPPDVIKLFWRLTHERRGELGTVLDVGAGDCRFAVGGRYRKYVGVEIDPVRVKIAIIPTKGHLIKGCAFRHRAEDYDACIGNPPYVRHHDIESPWKDRVVGQVEQYLGFRMNRKCNLFLYFMCLGLLKTKEDGLVAFVVPYEWVSRPSAEPVRRFIREQGWNVQVYRFSAPVFDEVLTTASISIIDKRGKSGGWSFFDVSPEYTITKRTSAVGDPRGVLEYEERGPFWAQRGLSPGSQKIFCLTEGERIHNGIHKKDVTPCVTTLRNVPRTVKTLTDQCFRHYFVHAGERCWLINSHLERLSERLKSYLATIPKQARDNYTCNNQEPWYNFHPHPVPGLLVSSGFTDFGPKVLVNVIGAHAVGSVAGIHCQTPMPTRSIQHYLLQIDFEQMLVPHAKTLKKIEMHQMNAILNRFASERLNHARPSS